MAHTVRDLSLSASIALVLAVAIGAAAIVGLIAYAAINSAGRTASEFGAVAGPLASAGATAAVVSALAALLVADRQIRASRELESARRTAAEAVEMLKNALTDERRAYVELYVAMMKYYVALRRLGDGEWSEQDVALAEQNMRDLEYHTLFLTDDDQAKFLQFWEAARATRDRATRLVTIGATRDMLQALWQEQSVADLQRAREAFVAAARPLVRRFPRSQPDGASTAETSLGTGRRSDGT
jgi:hypothetical protein